jgi:succinate--hydroxymethylglutarate CoA-transferase
MDYDTVSKINPSIVYASITGYGQTGPYRNRAGYDVMVEAYVVCISCLAMLICV